MSARDQTGTLAAPRYPEPQKAVCGSCAVCKTHLRSSTKPKLLPCLHTVCHTCVVKTRRDESTHGCPVCAQIFRLIEVTDCVLFEDPSNSNEDPKCSACEETEVSGWCVQCEEALCSDCISAHRRVKVTRDHEVKHKIPPTVGMPRRRCPSHSQESLRFFCLACEELTCKDCQLITHRGHSFVQQEEAVRSQRLWLQSLLESIRKQKEAVRTSLLLLEARYKDIQMIKSQASKSIAQLVHEIYKSLVLNGRQVCDIVEAHCAEEVKGLSQKKTILKKMEDCQDYIAAFIDKILSTEGHGLLVHKKKIETQLRKLLSQKTCPPETMFELHLQIPKDHFNIMKCGFMTIQRITVPFASSTPFTLAKSGEGSNLPSEGANSNYAQTATDVHPLQASQSSKQTIEGISTQSMQTQSNSPSFKCVPDVPPAETHLNHETPGNLPASKTQSTKSRKTWTFHYLPVLPPVSSKASWHAHPVPTNTQAMIVTNPVLTNHLTHRMAHPIPANNQTHVFQPPLPGNSTSARTLVLEQPIPYHNETHAHPIALNDQTSLLTQPAPVNIQPPVLTQLIPVGIQTTRNKTPILANIVSNVQTDPYPIQVSVLGDIHTFAEQPNIALTAPTDTRLLTTVYRDHCTGSSRIEKDSQSYSPCVNPANPSTGSGTSIPVNPTNSSHKVPVKALADSACDQEGCVSSTDLMATENPENICPTSTMPETDSKHSPGPGGNVNAVVPSSILQNLLTAATDKQSQCPLRVPPKSSLSKENRFETNGWSAGLPTSFRQLVLNFDRPAYSGSVNDKALLNLVSCSGSESLSLPMMTQTHDRTLPGDLNKEEPKKDNKDSAVTLDQQKQFKRFLRVNILRLPISLSTCGRPLPEFHLTTDKSADYTFEEKIPRAENKQVWRWNNDPDPSTASSLSKSKESVSPSKVQFCSICQSAGATLLCSKCSRAFHSDCHIPPIFVVACEAWVCLLCLNVNDEIIMYGSEQKRSLSLQDQRRCEKLLLSLMCEENRYLLYSVKRSKTPEFDIILGRLLGKKKPPYRTAAELVFDIWTLFDILATNSEKKDMVLKLRKSFHEQLKESFGKSLHASLLRCSGSKDSDATSQREKHKNTLKRMREFFMTNCGTVTKKPCTDGGKESEDNGNFATYEHSVD